MQRQTKWKKSILAAAAVLAITGAVASTGCQVSMNGMTLPSPWYLNNQLHYAPAGSEFPLPKEAAQMNNQRKDQSQRFDTMR